MRQWGRLLREKKKKRTNIWEKEGKKRNRITKSNTTGGKDRMEKGRKHVFQKDLLPERPMAEKGKRTRKVERKWMFNPKRRKHGRYGLSGGK